MSPVFLLIVLTSIFVGVESSNDGPFLRELETVYKTYISNVGIKKQDDKEENIESTDKRKIAIRNRRDTEGNPWTSTASARYAIMWAIIGGTIGMALLVILCITYYSYKNNDTSKDRHLERRRRRLWEEMARNSLDTTFYEDVSSNF